MAAFPAFPFIMHQVWRAPKTCRKPTWAPDLSNFRLLCDETTNPPCCKRSIVGPRCHENASPISPPMSTASPGNDQTGRRPLLPTVPRRSSPCSAGSENTTDPQPGHRSRPGCGARSRIALVAPLTPGKQNGGTNILGDWKGPGSTLGAATPYRSWNFCVANFEVETVCSI